MSDQDGIQLSPQLMQDLRDMLHRNDARCSDDILAMQYLVAAAGMLLAESKLEMNKRDALQELSGFMQHVFDYMENENRKRVAPKTDAMGVWKPGK